MDTAADLNLVTPCGSYCGECQNYQENCARGLRVRRGETVLGRVPILFLRKTEER